MIYDVSPLAPRPWLEATACVVTCLGAVRLWEWPGDVGTFLAELSCLLCVLVLRFYAGVPPSPAAVRIRNASILFTTTWFVRLFAGQTWFQDGAPIPPTEWIAWIVGAAGAGLPALAGCISCRTWASGWRTS